MVYDGEKLYILGQKMSYQRLYIKGCIPQSIIDLVVFDLRLLNNFYVTQNMYYK